MVVLNFEVGITFKLPLCWFKEQHATVIFRYAHVGNFTYNAKATLSSCAGLYSYWLVNARNLSSTTHFRILLCNLDQHYNIDTGNTDYDYCEIFTLMCVRTVTVYGVVSPKASHTRLPSLICCASPSHCQSF
jgi:hypothetical protein